MRIVATFQRSLVRIRTIHEHAKYQNIVGLMTTILLKNIVFVPNSSLLDTFSLGSCLFFFKLFICFWLHWVFVAGCGLYLVALRGGCLLDVVGRLLIAMASFAAKYRRSGARASVVAVCGLSSCIVRALESGLSSCGAQGSATPPHVESSQTRD